MKLTIPKVGDVWDYKTKYGWATSYEILKITDSIVYDKGVGKYLKYFYNSCGDSGDSHGLYWKRISKS